MVEHLREFGGEGVNLHGTQDISPPLVPQNLDDSGTKCQDDSLNIGSLEKGILLNVGKVPRVSHLSEMIIHGLRLVRGVYQTQLVTKTMGHIDFHALGRSTELPMVVLVSTISCRSELSQILCSVAIIVTPAHQAA